MIKKSGFLKHYNLLIIITLICSLFTISCSALKKPAKEKSMQQDEEKGVPKELNELNKNIEKIEENLMGIHEKEKKPTDEEEENEEKEGEEKPEEGEEKPEEGKEQDKSSDKKSDTQGGTSEKKEELQIQLKPGEISEYEKEKKKIENKEKKEKEEKETTKQYEAIKRESEQLHSLWNDAEPELLKSLAPQVSINNFEDALNYFTKNIEKPDSYANLVSLFELYRILPDFFELYNTKYTPEIDRLKFAAKKIKLISEKDDYKNMTITMDYLSERWEKAKPKLDKESIDSINKFDLALSDLKESIESKDKTIIQVKSEVLIKIIDKLTEEPMQGES